MLEITIPKMELFDESDSSFMTYDEKTISLEHSLLAISKWESKYKKPFLSNGLTIEEFAYYIKCMDESDNLDYHYCLNIPNSIKNKISDYVYDKKTATTVNYIGNQNSKKEIITSELVYYWMVAMRIPFECERWHFSRLMTLIEVCSVKNSEGDKNSKMSKADTLRHNAALNAKRRAAKAKKS